MSWHIGLDLDSTLYPHFQDEFEKAANKKGYKRTSELTTWNTWDHYSPEMTQDVFWATMAEAISDGEMFATGKPHAEAFDVMAQLISESHHLYIITARHVVGAELAARRATFKWIEEHLPLPLSGILISRNKALLPIHALLDDSEKNCIEVSEIGCLPVVFDQPWNQQWTGPRAYNLWDFYNIVQSELSNAH